jgi:two-component system sensor kinase FixL
MSKMQKARLDWRNALIFILAYVALGSVSYIRPLYGFNITPWNPASALGIVFILRFGRIGVPVLAFAMVAADALVRAMPMSVFASVGVSAQLAIGYFLIAEVLRRRLAGARAFSDLRELFEWSGFVLIGTLFNSLAFIYALRIGSLIPADTWPRAFARHWIGDVVGIFVSMPLFWTLLDQGARARLLALASSWKSLVYLVATTLLVWVAFNVGPRTDFKYFYVLLVPIVWVAGRQGLTGAVFGAVVIQLEIVFSAHLMGYSGENMLVLAGLAVVIALIGFFIGIVVDEKQRISAELRQSLRLAGAAEVAGALAHELNQPLTALSAYGAVCEQMLEQGESTERLRETIGRMVAESSRAADVVRRLRDFIRTGATRLERVALNCLITAAASPFLEKAKQRNIQVTVDPAPDCAVLADRLQLEIVLRNLLANAFDALAAQPKLPQRVRLSARPDGRGRVCVCVEDSGPGLSAQNAVRVFEGFRSSKSSGLGLGLAISRAIVEAHGGSMWAEASDHGKFQFLLPIEKSIADAA